MKSSRKFAGFIVALAIAHLGLLVLAIHKPPLIPRTRLVADLLQTSGVALAVLCTVWAARHSSKVLRRLWTLLGIALSVAMLAQALETYFENIAHVPAATPWLSDVLFIIWVLPALMMLWPWPLEQSSGPDWPMILDFVQVGIVALAAYLYFFYLTTDWQVLGSQLVIRIIKLQMFRDLALALAFLVKSFWTRLGSSKSIFRAVAVLFLLSAGSALSYLYSLPTAADKAQWFDVAWSFPYLFIAVFAATWKDPGPVAEEISSPPKTLVLSQLLPVAIPILVLLMSGQVVHRQITLAWGAIAASFCVSAARLILTSEKQRRLAESLLRSEAEREQSLGEQRKLEDQLRQSQKMEAIGRLAGGVAHDFNNLLGVIIGYTELLSATLSSDPSAEKMLAAIKTSADRAASLTASLLAFSRQQLLQPKVLDLNALVRETHAMLRRLLGEDIDFKILLDPELGKVRADSSQLTQVIMNLGVNARDAMPTGGKLQIETSNVLVKQQLPAQTSPISPGRYVLLAVSDTGHGMDAETVSRIFEPFFTTKPAGKGTGLGLATVYGIVQQSGGSIRVESAVGKGTAFKVYLPMVDQSAEPLSVPCTSGMNAHGSETILLVEDEKDLRALYAKYLGDHGYQILQAANGAEALQLAAKYPHEIHLLITDVIMPHMNGPLLVHSLRMSRSQIRVLYMSGYTDEKLDDMTSLISSAELIQKPFPLEKLAYKIRDSLNR